MGLFGANEFARARFYDDLATTLDSGIPLRRALELVGEGRPGRLGAAAEALAERLAGGAPLSQGMGALGGFGVFEVRVVEAGERAGRLPESLERLARHYEQRGKARDRIGYGMLYPLGLLHFGILIVPVKHLVVGGGLVPYAEAAIVPILALWAVIAGAVVAWRSIRSTEAGRRRIDAFLLRLPYLGGLARSSALLEYTAALGALFASGIPVVEAMDSAAAATRNAAFAAAGRRASDRVRGGATVYEALATERDAFPRVLVEAVKVGETSGKLDDTLARVERTAREDAEARMARFAGFVPAAVYLGVVGYIAYTIVSSYAAIYAPLRDLR